MVQHQPSSLCNRLEQSQLVAVPVAMQQQVPTFQKFENSGSSTVTVLDKFVGFSRYFRHEHVHLSNCWQWLLLHSVVKLLGGRVPTGEVGSTNNVRGRRDIAQQDVGT